MSGKTATRTKRIQKCCLSRASLSTFISSPVRLIILIYRFAPAAKPTEGIPWASRRENVYSHSSLGRAFGWGGAFRPLDQAVTRSPLFPNKDNDEPVAGGRGFFGRGFVGAETP